MRTFLASLFLFAVLLAVPALAQTPKGAPLTLDKIEGAFNNIVTFLYAAGGFIAVMFIMIAGIRWMTAGGDEQQVEKAKGMLKSALIGAAVVLGVGLILSTIANIF